MNIVIEPGSHHCLNMGDVAMMQVAARRLSELFPGATLKILTDSPQRLAMYVPEAAPLPAADLRALPGIFARSVALRRVLPERHRQRLRVVEMLVRMRAAAAVTGGRRLLSTRTVASTASRPLRTLRPDRRPRQLLDAMSTADIVVLAGRGSMTDSLLTDSLHMLDLLNAAQHFGATTVMLGQGLGPTKFTPLRRYAAAVLPKVDLITLRESRRSPEFLRDIGVDDARVRVTGDDAIELAHARRQLGHLGDAIGVNVRRSRYASIEDDALAMIARVTAERATRLGVSLLPTPISRHSRESDVATLRGMYASVSQFEGDGPPLEDPAAVIDQIGRCRCVVTGAYHSAVFALSQGIQVVALAGSPYYSDKLLGLAGQFPEGCRVVDMCDTKNREATLCSEIDAAFHDAERRRSAVLANAASQINRGRSAYGEIPGLVGLRGS